MKIVENGSAGREATARKRSECNEAKHARNLTSARPRSEATKGRLRKIK